MREKLFLPLLIFVLLIGIWQSVAILNIYHPSLFPSPLHVARGTLELIRSGEIFYHIRASMLRMMTGYLSAIVIAVPLGLMLGWYKIAGYAFDPLIQVLRPISPIAWMPLVGLWFGIGDLPAIFIIFLAAFFPVLLSTISAVKNIDPVYFKIADNFGTRDKDMLMKVVVPAAFPQIAMGFHIALGTAWVFLVAGEMMGVNSGLGFLIVDARNSLRPDLVISGMIIVGIIGLILDRVVLKVERNIKRKWGSTNV